MQIATIVTYLRPGNSGDIGRYIVSATFDWLIEPSYRMIDAMSIFVDDCSWSQNESDYYSYFSYYEYIMDGNTTYKSFNNTNEVIKADDFFYEYDLPGVGPFVDDYSSFIYTDLYFYMRGKMRLRYYDFRSSFSVFTKYEHTYSSISVQPSFSWTVGEMPGVSADVSLVNGSTPYHSHCTVEYDPNHNIYK